ncbi:hypothetical protein JCM3770_002858 [Rhodotorula araucariae]
MPDSAAATTLALKPAALRPPTERWLIMRCHDLFNFDIKRSGDAARALPSSAAATFTWLLSAAPTSTRRSSSSFPRGGDHSEEVRYHKPLDLPVTAEYATSPPCAKLVFLAGTAPVFTTPIGVKVRSVIGAATSMWASPAPAVETMNMTMWDTLGDCTFWAGMGSAKCVEDGALLLAPNDFDLAD